MKVQIWKVLMLGLLELVSIHTSVVQNSSRSVNISERLDKDDDEILNILYEFLNISDGASVSPIGYGNSLDTLIH